MWISRKGSSSKRNSMDLNIRIFIRLLSLAKLLVCSHWDRVDFLRLPYTPTKSIPGPVIGRSVSWNPPSARADKDSHKGLMIREEHMVLSLVWVSGVFGLGLLLRKQEARVDQMRFLGKTMWLILYPICQMQAVIIAGSWGLSKTKWPYHLLFQQLQDYPH